MKRIVITRPDFFEGEAAYIVRMLDDGAFYVHIRKPGAREEAMRALIEAIPEKYRLRLALHDHLWLAVEYGLGGVHLNSREPDVPRGFAGRVSRSCHSLDELRRFPDADYLFLSPVFDSISKPGYTSSFTINALEEAASAGLITPRVIALGGVYGSHFNTLRSLGFGGAALLGAAWQPVDHSKFRLQYITQAVDAAHPEESTVAGVRAALEGGSRWVQLRMKDAPTRMLLEVAKPVGELCRRYEAVFLLDDRVDLVEAVGAHGVHLGRNDMPVDQARRLLGPGYIVGATANTFADIRRAYDAGADYIGLGPLRFTTTKKNLSPVLGYDGYRAIATECRRGNISLPIVAIGGITPADIAPLAQAGVQGVAVSGAIAAAPHPVEAAEKFMNLINHIL